LEAHAGSANGKIVSFNQAIDPNIMRIAEAEGVDILDLTGPTPERMILAKTSLLPTAATEFKTASTEPSTSGNNEVFANIIRSGVGPVSEFDIEHAGSANGKIVSEDGLDVIDQFVDDVVVQNIDALRLCDTHDIRINGPEKPRSSRSSRSLSRDVKRQPLLEVVCVTV
jgi:hypothetical protein